MKKRYILLLISLLHIFTGYAQNLPAYVPSNGLIGWWPFNGNANDESGQGNNGTVHGALLSTDRLGNPDAAYYFDGISAYIETPDSPMLALTGDITMAAWVYAELPSNNPHFQSIISKRETGYLNYNMSISHYYNQFGSVEELKTLFTGRGNALSGFNYRYSNDTVTQFTWQHLVVRVENNIVSFYKNGTSMGNMPGSNILPNPTPNRNIGLYFGKTHSVGDMMQGKIDDIGIWHRGLSLAEIEALYQGNPTGLNNSETTSAIHIYPNPSQGLITVEANQPSSYSIYNMLGTLMLQGTLESPSQQIDLSQLPTGMYVFKHHLSGAVILSCKN